jgi:acyl dehydratase
MTSRFLEDFEAGQIFETAEAEICEADIRGYAERFDPREIHLGGLVASPFHALCLTFRLFFDLHLWDAAIIGSPGVRAVEWREPLRLGDRLRSRVEVIEVRRSQSKPDRGIVTMRHESFNQAGAPIVSAVCLHMIRSRP